MRQSYRQKALALLSETVLFVGQCFFMGALKPQKIRIKSRHFYGLAAMVMALGLMAPSAQAMDFNGQGQIILASLNTDTPADQELVQPGLFGMAEQRYSDLSAFTKWTGVLERFKEEFPKASKKSEVKDWMKFLGTLKKASKKEKIEAVNQYFNKMEFSADKDNYAAGDYWATPMEFLARGKGDCEDYAIAKYISLRALGFDAKDLRLAIVYDHVMRMPHAILVVYGKKQISVLDNQNPDVVSADDISRYKPIYAISQLAWWRY